MVARAKKIDWERVERDYRAGIRSLQDIGQEYGISAPGILKRAKKEGWTRNLAERIREKTEAMVSLAVVNGKVNAKVNGKVNAKVNGKRALTLVGEKATVEAVAEEMTQTILGQRADVKFAREAVSGLWLRLSEAESYKDEVSLSRQLTDALRTLIELERKVLRIPDQAPEEAPLKRYSDDEIDARIAQLIAAA